MLDLLLLHRLRCARGAPCGVVLLRGSCCISRSSWRSWRVLGRLVIAIGLRLFGLVRDARRFDRGVLGRAAGPTTVGERRFGDARLGVRRLEQRVGA
jgi:hypothetical protein